MITRLKLNPAPHLASSLEASICSDQPLSLNIRAFASSTHSGNVKPFNEDRVSVVPRLSNEYPDISLFAVYDGHGGQGCAEFLKESMPHFVARQPDLRTETARALTNAFKEAEEEFMRKNEVVIKDRSGSCACLVLVVGSTVYMANVGDSRAVIST